MVTEVVIIDNDSKDQSYELARSYASTFEKIKVIRSQENLGFPQASNIAVERTHAAFLLFLNPDTTVPSDFLTDLISVLENLDQGVAVIQPKILSTEQTIDSAGGIMDLFGHGVHVGKNEPDSSQYCELREILYACFACAIVRRKAFDSIGGLDPSYFLYGEDLDFCWRAWLTGWRTVYMPRLVVHHAGQHSTQFVPYVAKFHARKNTLVNVIANYSTALSAFATTLLLTFYLGGALRSRILGDRKDSKAFTRALVWIVKNMKYAALKRRKTQRSRQCSDRQLFKKDLITMRPYGLLLHLEGG